MDYIQGEGRIQPPSPRQTNAQNFRGVQAI